MQASERAGNSATSKPTSQGRRRWPPPWRFRSPNAPVLILPPFVATAVARLLPPLGLHRTPTIPPPTGARAVAGVGLLPPRGLRPELYDSAPYGGSGGGWRRAVASSGLAPPSFMIPPPTGAQKVHHRRAKQRNLKTRQRGALAAASTTTPPASPHTNPTRQRGATRYGRRCKPEHRPSPLTKGGWGGRPLQSPPPHVRCPRDEAAPQA